MDAEEGEAGEAELSGEQLTAELARLAQLELLAQQTLNTDGGPRREQLEQLLAAFGADAATVAAAATAAAAPAAPTTTHQRQARSRVWVAFDRGTNRCKLKGADGHVCGKPPKGGSGTSGYLRHLQEGLLPCSATSRLHLGYISATSRLHLGCISATSRLGYISALSRLHLGYRRSTRTSGSRSSGSC